MRLPDCNQRNPFLFVPQATENTHKQLYRVLTETQTELALLSWTCPSCVIYYLTKRQGQQQVLLGEVFFPTAVFLPSRKWDQVNSLYSVDIPQAFFQNVDESFSSSAFLPWTTAFPRIQHNFPETAERAGTSFLHSLAGCRFHRQLPQVLRGEGESMYKLCLSTKEISCY